MVFFGKARWEDAHEEHGAHGDFKPHESPPIMLVPLVVLAGLTIIGGFMQLPFSADTKFLEHWLEPVIEFAEVDIAGTFAGGHAVLLDGGRHRRLDRRHRARRRSCTTATASRRSSRRSSPRAGTTTRRSPTSWAAPVARATTAITWADAHIIDGAVNGVGTTVREVATGGRRLQTGNLRNYAAAIGCGAVLVLAWFVVVRGIL